jgi:hypothetical protein
MLQSKCPIFYCVAHKTTTKMWNCILSSMISGDSTFISKKGVGEDRARCGLEMPFILML